MPFQQASERHWLKFSRNKSILTSYYQLQILQATIIPAISITNKSWDCVRGSKKLFQTFKWWYAQPKCKNFPGQTLGARLPISPCLRCPILWSFRKISCQDLSVFSVKQSQFFIHPAYWYSTLALVNQTWHCLHNFPASEAQEQQIFLPHLMCSMNCFSVSYSSITGGGTTEKKECV